ncbi:MAG: class II glutamine amidotransferase, partial [Planctomycetota bacterium]
MCGFIGIVGTSAPVAPQMYEGLLCLQHRGQDAAGMITFEGSFHLKKGNGFVRDVFKPKNMERLRGTIGVGHVRYPTIGAGSSEDAQPFMTSYPHGLAIVHNGNVTNYLSLRQELLSKNTLLNSTCDVEALLHVLAIELASHAEDPLSNETIFKAFEEAFRQVKGSYSGVLMIAGYGLVAFRDPFGIKPCVYASRANEDGSRDYAIASENVSLDIIGFEEPVDVAPAEVVIFKPGEKPATKSC